MPANRKSYIHGTVVELTYRVEEGLPLVPTDYMKLIFEGILARAQNLYPVSINHFVVMSNHVHMMISILGDPQMVSDFQGYVKRETAHMINSFLGRAKHTVWCKGYDSPIILDAEKAIERIVYFYTNPQRAGLVERIEEYPNLNSWDSFLAGGSEKVCKRVPRDLVPRIPRKPLRLRQQKDLKRRLEEESQEEHTLLIEPDSWMQCFAELKEVNPEIIKNDIIARVRKEEQHISSIRKNHVTGRRRLALQSVYARHTPKKRGKRMICLSSEQTLRIRFLIWYRDRCRAARKVLMRWRAGDLLAQLPPGLYAPGGLMTANLNPAFTPIAF